VGSEQSEHDGPVARTGGPVVGTSGSGRRERLTVVCAYLALFLFGLLQGLIGCFQYSRGPAPLAAVGFDLAILATCLLSAWGMRTALGGLMPGVGWFVATFVLATGTQGGSVLITNTTAGQWFLFGGAACAAVGCLLSYVGWSRAGQGSRMSRRASR
jgi:hypothetical protein